MGRWRRTVILCEKFTFHPERALLERFWFAVNTADVFVKTQREFCYNSPSCCLDRGWGEQLSGSKDNEVIWEVFVRIRLISLSQNILPKKKKIIFYLDGGIQFCYISDNYVGRKKLMNVWKSMTHKCE